MEGCCSGKHAIAPNRQGYEVDILKPEPVEVG